MGTSNRVEKFSCATSRFLLPTFRRPSYREIMDANVQYDVESDVFSRWTKEDGQYYHLINTALLRDDYQLLKENVQFINSLRKAIRNNNQKQSIKVYRGLTISTEHVKEEYKVGLQFLWPTFICTSKNRDIAQVFGNYVFEIDASTDDWTYRTDISKYSHFPEEEEVLFYPYSGFVVKNIIHDAKVIQLECLDTLEVEQNSDKNIPKLVQIFDSSRNISVYLDKESDYVRFGHAEKPHRVFIIADNANGYWDAPNRYHHKNGYFIDKGHQQWEISEKLPRRSYHDETEI